LPQKYAHRKGEEGIGEKGGCLKKMHNAQKHILELILKRIPFSLKGTGSDSIREGDSSTVV
jgi:hypothetical protein